MKHVIKPESGMVTVEVSDIEGKEEELLANFQACREGRCSCPTDEYQKLESLDIDESAGKISLRLKAKSGRIFDEVEIAKCLDHTKRKLDPNR